MEIEKTWTTIEDWRNAPKKKYKRVVKKTLYDLLCVYPSGVEHVIMKNVPYPVALNAKKLYEKQKNKYKSKFVIL